MADVVSLLLEDHEHARDELNSFAEADRSSWGAGFSALAGNLAAHEAAEELAVYPILRDEVPGGSFVAEPRLQEQASARQLIAEMKAMDAGSDEFAQAFGRLRTAVLQHASEEEAEVLPLLRERLAPDRLTEMGEFYAKVKQQQSG